jgi:Protein of unknown function (DUF2750)
VVGAGDWQVSDQEFAAVSELEAGERYDYLVKRAVDWEGLWSLRSDDGWDLLADDEETELVPVWPHPRFAEACVPPGDPSEAARIPLGEWVERWLPGIERDGRKIAVFPTPGGRGAVIEPRRMLHDLRGYEAANY